jgi:serine protease Do
MGPRRTSPWVIGAAALAALAVMLAAGMFSPRRNTAHSKLAGSGTAAAAGHAANALADDRPDGQFLTASAAVSDSVDAIRRTALVRAAQRVAPSVVSVNILAQEAVQPTSLFESLLVPPGAEREVAGLGSGFIVDARGLVLTNEHVVHGATQIVVTLSDGRDFPAKVVGTDDVNDIALLRLELPEGADPLPVAPLGNSDSLMIGEWVVAIGNPFGFLLSNTEPTVTAGVVSGVHRNIIPDREQAEGGGEGGYYLDMIQTDAAINPGNSGGPLVNALGQVIGVNSSILSKSGGNEGLGFAIPIDRARRVAADLVDDGHVNRPWVGLQVDTAETDQWGHSHAVRIANVAPGSPAAKAGIRPGSILVAVGKREIHTPLDWNAVMLDAGVGKPLTLTLRRDGRDQAIEVAPTNLPSMSATRVQALSDFQLVTLTPAIRAERNLANSHGALIVGLSQDAQQQLGLEQGDLIVQINQTPIRTAEQAAALLRRLAGGAAVQMLIERHGQLFAVWFTVGG